MRKERRARHWTAIIYPESAPEDWMQLINERHIQWVCSPLHDKDVHEDGTPKKPHWHIIIMYDGLKSFEQVKELTDSVNAPNPQKVDSARGVIRYMVHMDDLDKYQYNVSDIKGFGGIDVEEYLKPIGTERYAMIGEMVDYVMDNDVVEFEDLVLYARNEKFDTWFKLLCDNSTYMISMFIKSRRFRELSSCSKDRVVVTPDGEVISDTEK